MTLDMLTSFFGWTVVLNIGLLAFTALILLAGRDRLAALHARLMGMEAAAVKKAYFSYLAQYKVMVLVFSIVPYVALKLI